MTLGKSDVNRTRRTHFANFCGFEAINVVDKNNHFGPGRCQNTPSGARVLSEGSGALPNWSEAADTSLATMFVPGMGLSGANPSPNLASSLATSFSFSELTSPSCALSSWKNRVTNSLVPPKSHGLNRKTAIVSSLTSRTSATIFRIEVLPEPHPPVTAIVKPCSAGTSSDSFGDRFGEGPSA